MLYVNSLLKDLSSLKGDVLREMERGAMCESNRLNLERAIEASNAQIEEAREAQARLKEAYQRELEKPPDIRYKNRTVEVRSNECDDIKSELDRIRYRDGGVYGSN